MKFNRKLVGISWILLPLLAATGCVGDKVIAPENGQIAVDIVIDPTVGPRDGGKPPFAYARVEVTNVSFDVSDPAKKMSFGPKPLEILAQGVEVDMTSSAALTLGATNISNGTYRLGRVFINKFWLNTSNEPPVQGQPRCLDGALRYAEFVNTKKEQARGTIPPVQPVFEVRSGSSTTIRVSLDGAALSALLESHVTCGGPDGTTAMVTDFEPSELASLFSIQVQ